ncbi:LuxR C-terminal-related transcriptional regulator [Rhodococcus sp. CSLK01-03]|uniref:LuxR C-terminal-related transcriptional regulator n=1 Tax=Rhodococcus indonesiensis TaxID=3055869 RepID=A0ABT7RK68_9NOCA|nr:LuxR C-terminal-related transcriptional regulator [Rhodococcus indonesiensis]MDM7487634.1 LuxR C-terminal-related transcriptional regulator [Rhodococcus indonesiensis]
MTGPPAGAQGDDAPPLSLARSSVPRLPRRVVRRPRLERILEEGVKSGLVLVSAPAGSGKTLLLASWAAAHPGPVAWLSVEREDAEPAQFWGRVLDSLRMVGGFPTDSLLATMRVPPSFDPRFVSVFVDACARLPRPVVLALDDMHLLAGTPAEESLAAAVRRGLGNVRLVVATRSDPALPLQRLRLGGELTEIRAEALRFDATEAAALLADHDVAVGPDELETLVAKTEGWAAGLRLAALSLRTSDDVAATVAALAGDERSVADYFAEEVLASQDPELMEFLLDTCVVGRVCGELADALNGRTDGQQLLVRLERDNLFVVALNHRRAWYRYHQLFGDLLRHRLRTEDPERRRMLHRRAAGWFADRGELLESARHLRAAEDWLGLARFVLRVAGAEILGPERPALVALLRDAPADLVGDHPEVAAAAGVAAYAEYDPVGVATHMARARELLDRLPAADARLTETVLVTLDAVLAWMKADPSWQIRAAQEAIRRLETVSPADLPAAPVYRIAAATVLAMGRLWSGDLDTAEAMLAATTTAVTARSAMTPVLALHLYGNTAVLEAMAGRLREARVEVDRALAIADELGWTFLPPSATALLAESMIRLLEADTGACSVAVARGHACLGEFRDRYTETSFGLVQARLALSTDNAAAARAHLVSLRRRMSDWVAPRFLAEWYKLVEAEILLAEGRPHEVQALLTGTERAQPGLARPGAHRTVLVARAHLATNEPRRCLELVAALLDGPPIDNGPTVDAWLLAALAHDRLRRDGEAQAAVAHALAVAAPEGIARPFLLAGDRARALLERHGRIDDAHGGFVSMLIGRLGGVSGEAVGPCLLEPLTSRERAVLLLLPTMMSNAEIADELFVSVNTVKVHLKSLYRKLGAANRRKAVVRARELGLLSASASSPAAP